jgi:hypothetical protein
VSVLDIIGYIYILYILREKEREREREREMAPFGNVDVKTKRRRDFQGLDW